MNFIRIITYRTVFLVSTIILTGFLAAYAQDGSNPYTFLNITSSSRIYGLGGVNITTVEDNIATVDQNPALLGPEMSNQIGLAYMRYIGDSNFASIIYSHSAGSNGAWQASLRYFGYGDMKLTDESGSIMGDFSPKDVCFSGGYTRDLSSFFRGGFNIKMIYSGYEQYSAFAIATDLGINYYNEDRDLSLSAVIANLGGQIKRFDQTYDRLPVDVRLGWSQSFGTLPIRFSITAWNLTKWKLPYYDTGDGSVDAVPTLKDSFTSNLFRHLIFGADFTPSDRFYISLGYNYKVKTDLATYSRSILSGFSVGAGLNVKNFDVSVAFAQPHKSATTFMFSLGMNLSDLLH